MRTIEFPIFTTEDRAIRPPYVIIADFGVEEGIYIFGSARTLEKAQEYFEYYKTNETTLEQAKRLEIVKAVWVENPF